MGTIGCSKRGIVRIYHPLLKKKLKKYLSHLKCAVILSKNEYCVLNCWLTLYFLQHSNKQPYGKGGVAHLQKFNQFVNWNADAQSTKKNPPQTTLWSQMEFPLSDKGIPLAWNGQLAQGEQEPWQNFISSWWQRSITSFFWLSCLLYSQVGEGNETGNAFCTLAGEGNETYCGKPETDQGYKANQQWNITASTSCWINCPS